MYEYDKSAESNFNAFQGCLGADLVLFVEERSFQKQRVYSSSFRLD
jgi:hypothetical protein